MKDEIRAIAHEDEITVYWEKDPAWGSGCRYRVLFDGAEAETRVTHFTRSAEPETAHKLSVRVLRADGGEVALGEIAVKIPARRRRIDITSAPYCAAGDGKTINTAAIQRAIDDCGAGETVYIPRGDFMTGAVTLHGDMELYIEEGGILHGTDCVSDYAPKVWSRFEGTELMTYQGLINIGKLDRNADCTTKNVVIRGKGAIVGGGRSLAEKVIAFETENMAELLRELGDRISEYEKPETIPGRVRPRLIHMCNCADAEIAGLDIRDGSCWLIHMIYCDGIVTHGCRVRSMHVWNGDGWDPDSSENCTLFDMEFHTGDDAVAIKSGKNPEGNRINRPTRHIRMFDVRNLEGGGISLGSEMSGGIEDVVAWDCDMSRSHGVTIKATKKRGGYIRDVRFFDCVMPMVYFGSVTYNDDGIGAGQLPVFRDCSFERVLFTCRKPDREGKPMDCEAMQIRGFGEDGKVENVVFRDITIGRTETGGGVFMRDCENVTFDGVKAI